MNKIKTRESLDRLAFNLLDLDGDNELSILDLVWMCSNFSEDTKLGQQIIQLFDYYMDKNIRPKYVKQKFHISFPVFANEMPPLDIVADLQYAFHTRVVEDHELKELEALNPKQKRRTKRKSSIDSMQAIKRTIHRYSFISDPEEASQVVKKRHAEFRSTQTFVAKLYGQNTLMLD